MIDPQHSALAEVKAVGLNPRRYRGPALLLRQLVWPVLRPWFLHGAERSERLSADVTALRSREERLSVDVVALQRLAAEVAALRPLAERLQQEVAELRAQAVQSSAEIAELRRQADTDRVAAAQARQQVDTLQGTLAAFTIERSFFEASIRTELMAVGNVVDCYRDMVDQRLPPEAARADPAQTGQIPATLLAAPVADRSRSGAAS